MCRRLLHALTVLCAVTALASCGSEEGGATATDSGVSCSYSGTGDAAKEVELPPSQAAQSGEVTVTMATSAGDLTATLDADATPCTVNSFVSLAQQGYFDSTRCHRLTTDGIFVLQCGDPTATGMGGPGYSFEDELTGEESYDAGTLAMANAGPDTNGSQFFIVYDDSELPAAYTVFGTVNQESTDLVQKVAAAGTDTGGPDGAPKTPVEIESVSVG